MADLPKTDDNRLKAAGAAGLRLKAEDSEDLAVISAILQDALVAVADMVFQPEEKRFVLVANRFRHETLAKAPREGRERVMTGLRIDGVTGVKRRGLHPGEAERLLVLLAVSAGAGAIFLDFAGGGSIRLESGRILCHLDDFGEPWPTRFRPSHPVEDAG
ncbi:MAG: DUF2948 family protein [Stellaceae bacterium]|jgi:hypothetical protein